MSFDLNTSKTIIKQKIKDITEEINKYKGDIDFLQTRIQELEEERITHLILLSGVDMKSGINTLDYNTTDTLKIIMKDK